MTLLRMSDSINGVKTGPRETRAEDGPTERARGQACVSGSGVESARGCTSPAAPLASVGRPRLRV